MPKDRTRLVGGGIKNLGFIETAYESASANSQFVPPYLNMDEYGEVIQDFTRKRTLFTLLQQFAQQVSGSMLLASDAAYRNALEYYNSVKEASRQCVPGAEAEYKLLSKYFKKSKPSKDGNAPTEAQIERDVRSLLHCDIVPVEIMLHPYGMQGVDRDIIFYRTVHLCGMPGFHVHQRTC
jgi:hypothetical protein